MTAITSSGPAGGYQPAHEPQWRFGTGAPQVVTIPNPPPTTGWSWNTPMDRIVFIQSICMGYVTVTTVGNRFARLQYFDGDANKLVHTPTPPALVASSVGTISYWDFPATDEAVGVTITLPIPKLLLPPNSRVAFDLRAVIAGDSLNSIAISYIAY